MIRWLAIFKGTDRSPIIRLEMEFRCAPGYEDEYVRKIERVLAPAVAIDSGPWPMDLLPPGYQSQPLVSDDTL